ncbi:TetR/AcrR family transcriptional regulator [Asticcacaulis sp. EMRT-3]|uniref:TetR/AcrR family transcriptional regulator n=1 Tax=Asticcacaulis sp. EMRT-3 TaxID=3040349 RepID=UPI0024AEDBA2|nr:TetR/AcrR family transcriptional regulator [Asticcacaulis sp. EMRT-3]MDI7776662.1 TetR/AcrR family transcriptional regulator [Asticcacaulis sp. EMRT-3]
MTPSREQRRQERRAIILDAAIACAIRSGFRGASMDEIAREAGLSVGVIYRYFSSKEAIIEAIVARDLDEIQNKVARIGACAPEELVALVLADADDFVSRQRQRDRAALRLEIYAEAARNPRVEAILRAIIEDERELGRQLFRRTLPYAASEAELTARADMFRVMADGLLANGLYAADGGDAFISTLRTVMRALLTKGCEA